MSMFFRKSIVIHFESMLITHTKAIWN